MRCCEAELEFIKSYMGLLDKKQAECKRIMMSAAGAIVGCYASRKCRSDQVKLCVCVYQWIICVCALRRCLVLTETEGLLCGHRITDVCACCCVVCPVSGHTFPYTEYSWNIRMHYLSPTH